MKDGVGTGEQAEVSRQELFDGYVNCYQMCTEVRPCRDASLLKKAAHYLLREPEPRGFFTVFPVYQVLTEGSGAPSTDYRKLLSAVIKAAELLETLCVNLFLHPWKKEIKTVKTFTGPFVYCLLPVLTSSTIQSVLASIGYLPHAETPQSEYRLSEDANPDRAMLVGFELLLARVECHHLLELLEKDQLGPQEWLDVLQRRAGPTKLEEPPEPKTTIAQKEDEKKGEADRKEAPLGMGHRAATKPQPKPRRCQRVIVDQSIMEMQMTYPDLAFRGRPLLTDKPHRANSSRSSSSKSVHTASTANYSDDSKAADLPTRDCIKGTRATATSIRSNNDGSKAEEVPSDDGRSSGCTKRNSGGTAVGCSCGNSDGSRADDELSGPQAISLHIVLRAGSTAEQGQKPAESQPTAEPPSWIQQHTAAGDPPSLSSMDEEEELRRLEERMGQLCVQEAEEETKRGEENTKKERKVGAEQNLRKPVTETGLALSRRHTRSSQKDTAAMKEQKQPTVGQPSLPTVGSADCPSWKEGGGAGQREEDTVRGEEEQLAQSFVIINNHKK